jgi:hypothetical protein
MRHPRFSKTPMNTLVRHSYSFLLFRLEPPSLTFHLNDKLNRMVNLHFIFRFTEQLDTVCLFSISMEENLLVLKYILIS